jgi:hypothetical protein
VDCRTNRLVESSRPSNGSLTAIAAPASSAHSHRAADCGIVFMGVVMQPIELSDEQPLHRYIFGHVEFDEERGEWRFGALLQLVACLLHRADEVVPRQELFDTDWAARPTVDNAVAKLRKASGTGEHERIINVPRVGYHLCGPVERTVSGRRRHSHLELTMGQPVPGRRHFRLCEQHGPWRGNELWLARHDKTGEWRVDKFSADGERLAALKCEAPIHRVLRESLGGPDDFVRVIDWNFEHAPFYLASEYGGLGLVRWAQREPWMASLNLDQRLHQYLPIVDAIVAAHAVDVLHKDIKLANGLTQARDGSWQARLADSGTRRLLESGPLQGLGVTVMRLTLPRPAATAPRPCTWRRSCWVGMRRRRSAWAWSARAGAFAAAGAGRPCRGDHRQPAGCGRLRGGGGGQWPGCDQHVEFARLSVSAQRGCAKRVKHCSAMSTSAPWHAGASASRRPWASSSSWARRSRMRVISRPRWSIFRQPDTGCSRCPVSTAPRYRPAVARGPPYSASGVATRGRWRWCSTSIPSHIGPISPILAVARCCKPADDVGEAPSSRLADVEIGSLQVTGGAGCDMISIQQPQLAARWFRVGAWRVPRASKPAMRVAGTAIHAPCFAASLDGAQSRPAAIQRAVTRQ